MRTRSAHSKYEAFAREECDLRHAQCTFWVLRAKIRSILSWTPRRPDDPEKETRCHFSTRNFGSHWKFFWNAFGNLSVGTTFYANLHCASFLWFTVFFLANTSFACFECWIIQLFSILARWEQSLVVRLDQFDCFPLLYFLEAVKTLLLQTPQKKSNQIKYFFNTHFYVFRPHLPTHHKKIVS